MLEHPRFAPPTEQGALFPVFKDDRTDRIVFNRVPRNRVEFHLPGYARYTIGGHDLLELHVPAGHQMRFFTDDLADCYPAMRASADRARTNSLAFTASLQSFAGTRAHRQFLRRCSREGVTPPRRVRPCHQGLPMGDLNAADWCAEAHTRLLRRRGSLLERRCLLNGRPAPRGGHVEALVLDDHLGIAIDPVVPQPGVRTNVDALHESFARAATAYEVSGWRSSAEKARRAVDGGTFLGAEVLAGSTLLGAEGFRRAELARASWALVLARRATPAVLRRLLAMWVHALLYRRPMLALLGSLHRECEAAGGENEVFALSLRGVAALARLAVLAPLMCSDLSAPMAAQVFAADASQYVRARGLPCGGPAGAHP